MKPNGAPKRCRGALAGPFDAGDVTLVWAFDGGLGCDSFPGVHSVDVELDSVPMGSYPCRVDGGVGLGRLTGIRQINVVARDDGGLPTFERNSRFLVDGDTRVNIDLIPVGASVSVVLTGWQFQAPPDPNSAECEVDRAWVGMCIDGFPNPGFIPCSAIAVARAVTSPIGIGDHRVEAAAIGTDGRVWYRYEGKLTVGPPPLWEINGWRGKFDLAVPGAVVRWKVKPQTSCANADLTHLTINFRNDAGNWRYPDAGVVEPCATFDPTGTGSFQGQANFPDLPPGDWQLHVEGRTSDGGIYRIESPTVPILTIADGGWPAAAVTVQLVR